MPLESSNAIENLAQTFGVEWPLLSAQILNFLLVTFLLYRFAFKPVLRTIEARQKQIADGLQCAEEARLQLAETEKQKSEVLRQSSLKAKKILDDAHQQAQRHSEEQKQVMEEQAKTLLSKSQESLAQERNKMMQEARAELANCVVYLSEKVLQQNLNSEQKKQFQETAKKELEQLK